MWNNSKQLVIWLKKAKTSLENNIKMIEEDKYCIDIIQQNLSVIWLLKSANTKLLEWHLSCCFVNAAKSNDQKRIDEMINEIVTIVKIAQNK
jgi:DNA-binding FrmR family transcriptional regulator